MKLTRVHRVKSGMNRSVLEILSVAQENLLQGRIQFRLDRCRVVARGSVKQDPWILILQF